MADAAAPVQAADAAPTEDLQQETVASEQGAGASAAETASCPETTRAASSSGSMLLDQIDKLKADQVALKATKAKLAKEMKNAVKRKKRLQGRASQLSDNDLVEVRRMRKHTKGAEGVVAQEDTTEADA